jgi:1-acyl-sn-glycerol-3-phosphate acyltransferase
MIYHYLRNFCGFILKFYIKKIEIKGLENHPKGGPVLIAANHPDGFLDAIVISCMVKRPIWSLARGDAFKRPMARKFLSKLFMMPIYRVSEGKEYMGKNDESFDKCLDLFKDNGQVLIFSEGICNNQKELLPLKKGTGRLAQQAWENGIDLQILPVGIGYNSYKSFGKSVVLNYGKVFKKETIANKENEGLFLRAFNENLKAKLLSLMSNDFALPNVKVNLQYYIGWIINFPMYFLLMVIVRPLTKKTVFYDSAMFGLMVFLLPPYWIFLIATLYNYF